MKNGTVDTNSEIPQVREVLLGRYVSEKRDGWKVVRTPWFTVLERICDAGANILPFAVPMQCEALWVTQNESGHKLLLPGQRELVIDKKALVRVTFYGE